MDIQQWSCRLLASKLYGLPISYEMTFFQMPAPSGALVYCPALNRVSVSLCFDSWASVVMPARSSARLAGAEIKERKPSSGFLSCSQIGQVGQSLLL